MWHAIKTCKHNIIVTDASSIRLTCPVVNVHVTDSPVVKVHVDELSSVRIWQHKLCATLSANVNINYRLPIKVYYHICIVRHQNRNKSWKPECVLSFDVGWRIISKFYPPTHVKTHNTVWLPWIISYLNYCTWYR
jgi:hypothetical protein